MAATSNLWHIDPEVYAKVKALSTAPTSYTKSTKAPYMIIEGGNEDKKKVRELYERCPVEGYAIAKVEVIYNLTLTQAFESKIQTLEQRHGNAAFDARWKEESKDKHIKVLRERVDYVLKSEVNKYAVANRHVKILPMFHGTNSKHFDSIFRTGFDNLATTDVGYFGKGIYNTSYAKYAWQVYSTGGFIFNWVAFYSAFPVIQQDMKTLVGTGKQGNYDANYVLVRPMNPANKAEKVFIPISQKEQPVYDELVVFESAQVLPRYIVSLAALNVKELASKPSKSQLVTAMDTLWKKAVPSLKGPLQKKLEAIKAKEQDQTEGLTKEEEWLHAQINGILENENNNDTDVKKILSKQLKNYLKISNDDNSTVALISQLKPAEKIKPLPITPDVEALYQQGQQLLNENKLQEAFKAWQAAADKGHIQAQYEVGVCFKMGRGVARDYPSALKYYLKAAEQNHPDAQDYVGHCYYNGLTLPKDFEKASVFFQKAASQGNLSSTQYLAICYENGQGVAKNENLALELWKKAADKGNASAQYHMAQIYKLARNYPLAVNYAQKAADQGIVEAQDYIGHCYYNGYSVTKDFTIAVKYFKLAAAQNNASSQEYLSICYARGEGVAKNLTESAKFCKLAADHGVASAQYSYGISCLNGLGVPKNLDEAKRYLGLSAHQNYPQAVEVLASIK